jgi:hypothetical protein
MCSESFSQVSIRGVFTGNVKEFRAGDTAIFNGAREDAYSKRLYYYLKGTNGQVAADKVDLLTDDTDFWELQQFYHTSQKIAADGWEREKRDELDRMTLEYITRLEAEGKIYNDKYAEDFLQQLIQKIHYPKIYKGKDYFLSAKIVNTDKKYIYSFDNGTLLITTQLLAETTDYNELVVLFSRAIAHILLNSNLPNVDTYSPSEIRQLGAVYSEEDKAQKRTIAERFISYTNTYKLGLLAVDPDVFTAAMAGIIGYTAWQSYYVNQYSEALVYISRLEEGNLANSSDLHLKAKCYMEIANNDQSNGEAYNTLLQAASFNDEYLPQIYSEMGLVLMRLRRFEDARSAYLQYQQKIMCINDPEQQAWVLKMIKACNYFIEKESGNAAAKAEDIPASEEEVHIDP